MPPENFDSLPPTDAARNQANSILSSVNNSQLFHVQLEGDTVFISPRSRLSEFDFALIEIEGKQIANWLEQQTLTPHLVVDLENSEYFGSSAVGTFVRWWRIVNAREGRLAMCNLSAQATELLRITQLDSLWHIAESRDAAIRWIAAP